MSFLLQRLRDCLRSDAYPYERRVCLWAFAIRNALQTATVALWIAFAVFRWPSWLPGFRPVDLRAWDAPWWPLGLLWIAWGAWGAGALAAFLWADCRLEEWWRELWLGCSVAPSIVPTCTLEAFNGFPRGGYAEDAHLEAAWNRDKFRADVHRLWEGQPGSGRYDVLAPEDVTWAVRLHHRWIRPWARRRGWVVG